MAKTIYIDTTSTVSTYPFSVVQTGNSSTLNGDINATVTTITLADASTFASSGSVRIGEELITYTGKSGNDLTGCVRNYYYSPSLSHTSGVTVYEVTCTLGSNKVSTTSWDYFPDNADVGSAIYFVGSPFYSPNISGVRLYVGTAMSSSSHTLVFEAYDRRDGGWTELPGQIDNTNQLTTTGQNWWTFQVPWWYGSLTMGEVGLGATMPCRLRLTAVSGLTEGGANTTSSIVKRGDFISIAGGTTADPVTMTDIYDQIVTTDGWTDLIERSPTSGKDDNFYSGNYFLIHGVKIYLVDGCVFSSSVEIIIFLPGHFDGGGTNPESRLVKISNSVLSVQGFGYNMNVYWSGATNYEFVNSCVFMGGAQFTNYSANFTFTKSILNGGGDGNFYGGYKQKWDRSATYFSPNTYTAPSVRDWTFEGSNVSGVSAYQDLTGLVIRDATIGTTVCNANTTNAIYDVNTTIPNYGYQPLGSSDMNLYEHYSMTLRVVDEVGDPIQGATVIYKDKNGNPVTRWVGSITSGGLEELDPVSTDASGYTSTEDILYRHRLITHTGSVVTTDTYYYPTTITIKKAGYKTESITVVVKPKQSNIVVLKREHVSIDQEAQI